MTREELEACRNDPHNQKWGAYHCKADPRVIVPKRLKWMGWAINAARPSAIPVMLLMLAILAVPGAIVTALDGGNRGFLVAVAASVAVVCLLCAFLSSSKRWIH
jgi:Family of unknown function (DUF5808)